MFFSMVILIFAQFNPASELQDIYSSSYFSTAFLMKGVEEYIVNPSYLHLLSNAHLLTNFRDFRDPSNFFVIGGNLSTEPLREGGLVRIGGTKASLDNSLGFKGYSRKDTVEYADLDSNGVSDRAILKKFETNGDSTFFHLSGYAGFQFLFEDWYIAASLMKKQESFDAEIPGSLENPLGYFAYREIEVTYPDYSFVKLVEAKGDYLKKGTENLSHVRLGGGYFFPDSSFVSILVGYRILEDRLTNGAYYSFTTDLDTTRQEIHYTVEQFREDEEKSLEGNGFSFEVNFFRPKGRSSREISLAFTRDKQNADTIWKLSTGYVGVFNTVSDTFVSQYDSTGFKETYYTSTRGKSRNYFKGSYSEVIELNENFRLGFGINGYFSYLNFPRTYSFLDSTEVIFSDGDTMPQDSDDYSRYVFYRMTGFESDEEKKYELQIPFGVEVNPFGFKRVALRAGTIFSLTHQEISTEKRYTPSGVAIDSTFRGDSTSSVKTWSVAESRYRNSYLEEIGKVYFLYGVSLDVSENFQLAIILKHDTEKFRTASVSAVLRF